MRTSHNHKKELMRILLVSAFITISCQSILKGIGYTLGKGIQLGHATISCGSTSLVSLSKAMPGFIAGGVNYYAAEAGQALTSDTPIFDRIGNLKLPESNVTLREKSHEVLAGMGDKWLLGKMANKFASWIDDKTNAGTEETGKVVLPLS